MYSFPQCLHSFYIKDPAEFGFFLLGFLCPQGKYFRGLWLGIYTDSSLLWIMSLFPLLHVSLLLWCIVHCYPRPIVSMWEESPSFCQEGCECFLLLVAEHNPSICFFYCIFCYIIKTLNLLWNRRFCRIKYFTNVLNCSLANKFAFHVLRKYIKVPIQKNCALFFIKSFILVSFILWVSAKSTTLSLGHFLAFSYSFPHETNFLLFFFFFF